VCLESPQYETEVLGGKLGLRLVCKAETATPIRSYKSRGTAYLLQRLEGEEGRLVCASAGNLGQGLAHAARKRNVLLMMFAAQSANPPR
jgi:threonine dehydratase